MMTRKRKCHSKSNSFVGAAEQVCLQSVLAHRQRRGRRNIAWQAVSHLCSSNRKGTTSDSWATTGRNVKLFSGGGREPASVRHVGDTCERRHQPSTVVRSHAVHDTSASPSWKVGRDFRWGGHQCPSFSSSVKSNQIYLLKTRHIQMQQVVKAVDEQGQQGSKEHLQWPCSPPPVIAPPVSSIPFDVPRSPTPLKSRQEVRESFPLYPAKNDSQL